MIQDISFWFFLAGSVIGYWLLPGRIRHYALAVASFAYLATIDLASMLFLLGWSIAFYLLAPRAVGPERSRRWVVPALIVAILSYLAYFKYIPPLVAALASNDVEKHLIIPLGISYYSFKLVHYAIEVGRGNVTDRSFGTFVCYIYLFPTFTAGPIERFDHFLSNRQTSLRREDVVEGLMRIIYGLVKKLAIGVMFLQPLLKSVDNASVLLERISVLPFYKVWAFLIINYLFVYLDFSAYSDIAIGASRLFGIKIMENFNLPILAPNISNFWKRWHMTLAGWCQAYVYMPMIGLTRRPNLAVYCTMTVMALWHAGALNWIFWGWYHATGLVIYGFWTRFKRKRRIHLFENVPVLKHASIIPTFVFVTGSYVFTTTYGHGGLKGAFTLLAKLFNINLTL